MKRKPEVQTKPTAYEVLNAFIKEKGIVLGLSKSQISFTDTNQILISPPTIFAVYKDELPVKEEN